MLHVVIAQLDQSNRLLSGRSQVRVLLATPSKGLAMKRLTLTVTLATDVDLHNVHIDDVANVRLASVDQTGYTNVRFQKDQSREYDTYSIVGERLETEAEARRRIEAKKRVALKKKEAKQQEIVRLEKALAKLRRK